MDEHTSVHGRVVDRGHKEVEEGTFGRGRVLGKDMGVVAPILQPY